MQIGLPDILAGAVGCREGRESHGLDAGHDHFVKDCDDSAATIVQAQRRVTKKAPDNEVGQPTGQLIDNVGAADIGAERSQGPPLLQ